MTHSDIVNKLASLPLELTEEELKHVSAHTVLPIIDVSREPGLGSAALTALGRERFHHPIVVAPTPPDIGQNSLISSVREQLLTSIVSIKPPTLKMTITPEQIQAMARAMGVGNGAGVRLSENQFLAGVAKPPARPPVVTYSVVPSDENTPSDHVRYGFRLDLGDLDVKQSASAITTEYLHELALSIGAVSGVPKRLVGDEFLPGCAIPPPVMRDCVFWKNARLNRFNPDVPDSVPIFNIPKSDPTGKSNIAGSLGINRFGDFDGDSMMGNWCAPRIISGLLRRKTKKGPKRVWATKYPHTRAHEKENYFILSGDQWAGTAMNNVMEFLNHGV